MRAAGVAWCGSASIIDVAEMDDIIRLRVEPDDLLHDRGRWRVACPPIADDGNVDCIGNRAGENDGFWRRGQREDAIVIPCAAHERFEEVDESRKPSLVEGGPGLSAKNGAVN